jgi:hypothetical protein
MASSIQRREFLQLTAAATAFGLAGSNHVSFAAGPGPTKLLSPGCRRSKVKVARLYVGTPGGHWPKPALTLEEEMQSYQPAFAALKDELADCDFFVDQLVTSPKQVQALAEQLKTADGILVIHLKMGIGAILSEILKAGRPTVVFAIPYSGHEWAGFGQLQKRPEGELFDAILTTDRKQLAVAIRPFRAIHHLREAKVLDVTTRLPAQYAEQVKVKFGTEIKQIGLQAVVDAYNAVSDADAQGETDRWLKGAVALVEPTKEEVFRACKQALAFERMLAAEDATVLTVDCYGSMWDKTIKLPAYPCLGFSRLNGIGLGGICE